MAHRATASIDVKASIETVLDVGVTVEDMVDWFPLPIKPVDPPASGRLEAGDACTAVNTLAGRRVETRIEILRADRERYVVRATGPLNFTVDATLTPTQAGCRIEAWIEARASGGLKGRVLDAACRPLLGPGIRHALDRIAALAESRGCGRAPGAAAAAA